MMKRLAQSGGMKTQNGGGMPNRGFTLIEIMVVVAIIVLLIGLLIPALSAIQKSSRKTATLAQMKGIVQACETYHNDFNSYPGLLAEESFTGATATGYTGIENMLVSLSLRWYTAQPTDNTVKDRVINIPGTGLYQEVGQVVQANSYASYGKSGVYDGYLNLRPTDLTPDLSRWPLVNLQNAELKPQTIPVLGDASGFKGSAMPFLYFRQANKWNTDRGSNSAVVPPRGIAGTAPTAAIPPNAAPDAGQACYYVSSNNALTSNTPVNAGPFDAVALWNLTDASRKDLQGIGSNKPGFTAPGVADYATYAPRGGFVLISAGLDRIYGPDSSGNSDDLIMEGGSL